MNRILLEICVDDAAGIEAAIEGGADRIELCSALGLGGLTPSSGLIAIAATATIPVMAMIRPRAGDFVWSDVERGIMCQEIDIIRNAGLAGIVIGASKPDGRLDNETLEQLVEAAGDMDITLHRAIDLTPDPVEAMQVAAGLGIRRVLSSGGAKTAEQGIDRLDRMAHAVTGVSVMPGGGVSDMNTNLFATRLPLTEIHASASIPAPVTGLSQIVHLGFQSPDARRTDTKRVAALRFALDQIVTSRPSGCTSL